MLAGLIRALGVLQLAGTVSAAATCTDTANGAGSSASFTSYFAPTSSGLSTFLQCAATATIAITSGATSASATLSFIAGLGPGSYTVTGSTSSGNASVSASFSVTFTDAYFYVVGGAVELRWTALVVVFDGTTVYTDAGGSFSSPRLAPSGLPVLGILPQLLAAGGPAAIPVPNLPSGTTPASHLYTGNGAASGGWRFQEVGSSTWQTLPVSYNYVSPPSASCSCSPGTASTISATNTFNGSVSGGFSLSDSTVYVGQYTCYCDPDVCPTPPSTPSVVDVYNRRQDYSNWLGMIQLVPALTRSVKRMGSDYLESIERGGIPSCTAVAAITCQDVVAGTGPTTTSISDVIVPSYGGANNAVGNATHSIEDPMSAAIYAPYESFSTRILNSSNNTATVTHGDCVCIPGHSGSPTVCWPEVSIACEISLASEYLQVQDIGSGAGQNPALIAGLYNDQAPARYIDYVCNPHWSYSLYFPASVSSGAIQPAEWPVDGNRANPNLSWQLWRSQYMKNPPLSGSEASNTRTDVIAEPMLGGALKAYWASLYGGNNIAPWGVSRFKVSSITLPASVTLNSSDASATATLANCTAAYGGGSITLTPTGSPASCSISFALGSYANAPYQVLALIQQIVANWSGSGIASATVSVLGGDGASASLGAAPGTYSWPTTPTDAKYAGSYGQDFSAGYSVSDTGMDVPSGGESATLMASTQGVFDYQLLLGFTAAKLTFTFEISNPADTITLDYPEFILPSSSPTVVPETGMTFAIIWPDGPGVRFGQLNWGSSIGTPSVYAFGNTSTVLDALAFANVIQGLAPNTNVTTELAGYYTLVEGQSEANAAVNTHAFPIVANGALSFVLVNSFAEMPPLCQLPLQARDGNMQPTGAYVQEAWSHSQQGRYLVSPATPTNLFTAAGVQWTSAYASPPGWFITRHSMPVNNSENATFLVKQAGVEYATASPWHGYLCVLSQLAAKALAYDRSASLRHARAYYNTGTSSLEMGFAQNWDPHYWTDAPVSLESTRARIRWQEKEPQTTIGIIYVDGSGNLLFCQTPDEGQTFTAPTTIATDLTSGGYFDYEEGPNGQKYFVWQTGSAAPLTLKTTVLDWNLNVVLAETATTIADCDLSPMAVRQFEKSSGEWGLAVAYVSGGNIQFRTAPDGYTFAASTESIAFTAGGYFDFDQDDDGVRHFVYQVGSPTPPMTLYYRSADLNGNSVQSELPTTITNADLSPIAIRMFTQSGGKWQLGCLFSASGALSYEDAPDGLTFS